MVLSSGGTPHIRVALSCKFVGVVELSRNRLTSVSLSVWCLSESLFGLCVSGVLMHLHNFVSLSIVFGQSGHVWNGKIDLYSII